MSDKSPVIQFVQVEVPITEDDLLSIACGFMPSENNGSGYWANFEIESGEEKVPEEMPWSEAFAKGIITLHVYEREDIHECVLTREKLIAGISVWCKASKRLDFANVDSLEADEILQFAMFGELVYG